MTVFRLMIVSVLILLSAPLYAQATDDLFGNIHANLLRAADRELQLHARSLVPQSHNEPPTTIKNTAQETDGISHPGLRRLEQLYPFMAPIFAAEGVPHEFLLVALVESGYRSDAVSPAEAVGMWQFIPSTARRFGLLDESGDYRMDFERATRAAARYLWFLLNKFSDWRLALAAYNAGEDRVERAIQLGRTRDFAKLSDMRLLPEETRNYVPSVLRAIAEARNLGILQENSLR